MNDKTLVQRLRDSFVYDQRHYAADPLIEEAANTIEALQSDLSRQMAIATEYVNKSEALQSRIEALEAALENLIAHCHEQERILTEDLHHTDFCGESIVLLGARQALAGDTNHG